MSMVCIIYTIYAFYMVWDEFSVFYSFTVAERKNDINRCHSQREMTNLKRNGVLMWHNICIPHRIHGTGIFTYIYHKTIHVGKYAIHEWYGY